ncbi:MAG: hypothetical protein WC781_03335 [Candidatus Pacearchaeota archaeon]|jgi:hypothetical protein
MKNNKQTINKKKVDKLFNSFLKEDLLEDRSDYDEEDLQLAYPKLNKKEVKLLYLKIQKWKYSKEKKKKPNKIKIVDDCE